MAKAFLSRREHFCASHRLHVPTLSVEENQALFGKCNWPHGHGHNYTVIITLYGPIEPTTGIVFDLQRLKELAQTHVLDKVDHKNLNLDVPEFETLNPAVENIAVTIWRWLSPHLQSLLYEVRVLETEKNEAFYRGEGDTL